MSVNSDVDIVNRKIDRAKVQLSQL